MLICCAAKPRLRSVTHYPSEGRKTIYSKPNPELEREAQKVMVGLLAACELPCIICGRDPAGSSGALLPVVAGRLSFSVTRVSGGV